MHSLSIRELDIWGGDIQVEQGTSSKYCSNDALKMLSNHFSWQFS
jgi:hypothetical protein